MYYSPEIEETGVDLTDYDAQVSRLARDLGRALYKLSVDPEAQLTAHNWRNPRRFWQTMETYLIVEKGISPDTDEDGAMEAMHKLQARKR